MGRFFPNLVGFFSASAAASFFQALWAFLKEQMARQQGHLILWAPVFFSGGIGVYFSLSHEPPAESLWFTAALAMVCGGMAAGLWRRNSGILHALVLLLAFAALGMAGFAASQIRVRTLDTVMLEHKGRPAQVTGIVRSVERLAPGQGARIVLEAVQVEGLAPQDTPGRIRLRLRQENPPQPGERISALAALSVPAPPVMPGAYDFARDAYFKGLGASGFVYGKVKAIPPGDQESSISLMWEDSLFQFLEKLRQTMVERTERHLDSPVGGMVATYLTGEGSTISEQDWTAMRVAGLAHLLAISGMNVGIVAGIAFFFIRLFMAAIPPLALRFPIKKIAAVFAFFAALFYTLLVGAQIPALRSLLMTALALLAVVFDRSPFSMRLLSVSALAVLALYPESLLGASFQMSYAAVAALIFAWDRGRGFFTGLYRDVGWLWRAGLYFVGVCMTTVVATLATAPFAAFHFQQIAVYGLLANLIGVPAMSFIIMPGAILTYLLMPFGLEKIPLEIVAFGVDLTLRVAHGVAALPGASPPLAAWPMAALVLVVCGGVWAMLWEGWGRVLGLAPVMAALVLIAQLQAPDLLVSTSGKLIGVRAGQALYVSTNRSDRFDRDLWLKRLGFGAGALRNFPHEGGEALSDGAEGNIACDSAACRIVLKNRPVALVRTPEVLAQECDWAGAHGIVLADFLRRRWRCQSGAQTIWLWEVRRTSGALAFVFPADPAQPARIDSASQERGKRPWTGVQERHSFDKNRESSGGDKERKK